MGHQNRNDTSRRFFPRGQKPQQPDPFKSGKLGLDFVRNILAQRQARGVAKSRGITQEKGRIDIEQELGTGRFTPERQGGRDPKFFGFMENLIASGNLLQDANTGETFFKFPGTETPVPVNFTPVSIFDPKTKSDRTGVTNITPLKGADLEFVLTKETGKAGVFERRELDLVPFGVTPRSQRVGRADPTSLAQQVGKAAKSILQGFQTGFRGNQPSPQRSQRTQGTQQPKQQVPVQEIERLRDGLKRINELVKRLPKTDPRRQQLLQVREQIAAGLQKALANG